MPKRHYVMALACYLAIPVVVMAGGLLFVLIDPEMARGHSDYVRDYQLLEFTRLGALMGAAGLALILWVATCYLVLKSRQRSLGWLLLAIAGPLGFSMIAMLEDRSPRPEDRYQELLRKLQSHWRLTLEMAVLAAVWFLAYQAMVLQRELMIVYESFTTGTPTADIVARQNASSGMWAFGEGLEALYLVVLIYLLWPMAFNLAGRWFHPRTDPPRQEAGNSGG